jgi:xanthine/uracil/vitamin C permease (AzgA family)
MSQSGLADLYAFASWRENYPVAIASGTNFKAFFAYHILTLRGRSATKRTAK